MDTRPPLRRYDDQRRPVETVPEWSGAIVRPIVGTGTRYTVWRGLDRGRRVRTERSADRDSLPHAA